MEVKEDGAFRLAGTRRARIYVLEARSQFLAAARMPAFTIPTLVFPLMFYVFFGVLMGFSPIAPTYLLATYGVFGTIGPSLFGFGVGLATERDRGALLLKQTTPMPATAHLLARVSTALVFGAAIVLGLFVLGAYAAGVSLYRWQWFALTGSCSPGCFRSVRGHGTRRRQYAFCSVAVYRGPPASRRRERYAHSTVDLLCGRSGARATHVRCALVPLGKPGMWSHRAEHRFGSDGPGNGGDAAGLVLRRRRQSSAAE